MNEILQELSNCVEPDCDKKSYDERLQDAHSMMFSEDE